MRQRRIDDDLMLYGAKREYADPNTVYHDHPPGCPPEGDPGSES